MVQLNNTEDKGYKVITPEEQALNDRIVALPAIKELHQKSQDIKSELDELNDKVDSGFSKGKEKMEWLETMFTNHINRTEEMHSENQRSYSDLKQEIKDNKFKDVTQELKEKNKEIEAIKNKFWGAVKMVMNGIISVIAGGLIVYFFKG